MKRTLLALLLSPLFSNAQMLEGSISLGPVIHNFIPEKAYGFEYKRRPSYNVSLSGTVKIPYSLRVGGSISFLKIGHLYADVSGIVPHAYHVYTDPLLFELIIVSRTSFKRSDLDIGITGGICGHKRSTATALFDYLKDSERNYNLPWYTYGLVGSYQYRITSKSSLGVELQVKRLSARGLDNNIFVMPVLVKGTIRI